MDNQKFNDPLWPQMWYIEKLNITAAWAMGYSRKGVVVTIVTSILNI